MRNFFYGCAYLIMGLAMLTFYLSLVGMMVLICRVIF